MCDERGGVGALLNRKPTMTDVEAPWTNTAAKQAGAISGVRFCTSLRSDCGRSYRPFCRRPRLDAGSTAVAQCCSGLNDTTPTHGHSPANWPMRVLRANNESPTAVRATPPLGLRRSATPPERRKPGNRSPSPIPTPRRPSESLLSPRLRTDRLNRPVRGLWL
jgi:hypothetical protein